MTKRILSLLAALAVASTAACGGDANDADTTVQRDTFTEQDTTMAPVVTPVVTQDTGIVETTVETDVDVDTDTIRRP